MTRPQVSLFLLEDDPVLGEGLRTYLQLEGFEVDWQHGYSTALQRIQQRSYDLYLLDITLPQGSGIALQILTATTGMRLCAVANRNIGSAVGVYDQAGIERIAAINPYINAVTATAYERARAEARAAEQAVMRGDALGLLHGLPMGVKDLEPTAGLLTTFGSPIYRANVPAADTELVKKGQRLIPPHKPA